VRAGRSTAVRRPVSIVRANVLTVFSLILAIAVVAPALAGAAVAIAGLAVLDERFIPGRNEHTASALGGET
jgi:hypothetical protein